MGFALILPEQQTDEQRQLTAVPSTGLSYLSHRNLLLLEFSLLLSKWIKHKPGRSHDDIPDVASWVVPHSEGPRFPGPLLIRTRFPVTSSNSTL